MSKIYPTGRQLQARIKAYLAGSDNENVNTLLNDMLSDDDGGEKIHLVATVAHIILAPITHDESMAQLVAEELAR
jgi:hypothetical protein